MSFRLRSRTAWVAVALTHLAGCAYEIGFDPAYVPDETPRYLADGKILVVMPDEQQEFVYSYTRIIEQGFDEGDVDSWIIPEVEISFDVRAFDRRGGRILEKTYDSGVMAGESYRVTSRPAERINQALHATLHALMLQVAADIKPLLIGECTITDIA
jgi:hypothetical protein